jgi:hypothetical protein
VIAFEGLTSGGGAPHRVRAVGNLTRTPDADEVVLDVSEGRALVASEVGREVTSVAVVDLSGDPEVFLDDEGRPRPAGERVKLAAVHWQELGRPGGVGQRVYALEPPVAAIKGRFEGDFAVLESGEGATARLRRSDGAAEGALGLQAQPREVTVESWVQFAVNRARAVPWIGASKIALLEKYVFDRVDRGRQLWYGVVGVDREELAAQMVEGGQAHASPPPQAPEVIKAQEEAIALGPAADWPLPDLKAPAASWPGGALEGEGQWRRWEPAWIDKLGAQGEAVAGAADLGAGGSEQRVRVRDAGGDGHAAAGPAPAGGDVEPALDDGAAGGPGRSRGTRRRCGTS